MAGKRTFLGGKTTDIKNERNTPQKDQACGQGKGNSKRGQKNTHEEDGSLLQITSHLVRMKVIQEASKYIAKEKLRRNENKTESRSFKMIRNALRTEVRVVHNRQGWKRKGKW